MNTQPDLVFNPVTGSWLPPDAQKPPANWRDSTVRQWNFNPWVRDRYNPQRAHARVPGDIITDPLGLAIWEPNWGPMPAAAKSAPTKDPNPKSAAGDAKVPLYLCSPIAMAEWSLAQFAGMEKYGLVDWREAGVRASTYVSALLRHAEAFNAGEDRDPDDNTDHLGNIMACCGILLEARALGLLTDDRPRAIEFRKTWLGVQRRMKDIREKYVDRHPTHYTIERDKALSTDE